MESEAKFKFRQKIEQEKRDAAKEQRRIEQQAAVSRKLSGNRDVQLDAASHILSVNEVRGGGPLDTEDWDTFRAHVRNAEVYDRHAGPCMEAVEGSQSAYH